MSLAELSARFHTEALAPDDRTAGSGMRPGLTRSDFFYVAPPGTDEWTLRAIIIYVISRGTSPSTSPAAWRVFTLSIIALAFPGFRAALALRGYRAQELSRDAVTVAANALRVIEAFGDSGSINQTGDQVLNHGTLAQIVDFHAAAMATPAVKADFDAETTNALQGIAANLVERVRATRLALWVYRTWGTLEFDPGLPAPPATLQPMLLYSSLSLEAIYGYIGLVLYLAGKKITGDNITAITVRRPAAIEAKYGRPAISCLSGAMRLSTEAHAGIHQAWIVLSGAREVIFSEVAHWVTSTEPAEEVVATVTKLLRYSGMAHVAIIHQFIAANPWVAQVASLRPALMAYRASYERILRIKAARRPYYKVVLGDRGTLFDRRTLEPLTVCAVAFLEPLYPSLAQYTVSAAYDEVIREYNEVARAQTQALPEI
jgi:hypothetical protein